MFLWAGLHQACIRNHSGAVKDLKFGRNERIYVHFEVIMFFRKDPPQTEGRRNADPLIKTSPGGGSGHVTHFSADHLYAAPLE